MRTVSTEMTEAWVGSAKTGQSKRPSGRATIQLVKLSQWDYQGLTNTDTGTRNRALTYRSVLFSQPTDVLELPNLISINWSRSTSQDVAECTLVLSSSIMSRIGDPATDEYDDKGALTPSRGTVYDVNPWNHQRNPWQDILVPDRLVRTYEGYGINPLVYPAADQNLKQSGTWLIDDVTLNDDGNIEVKMRDIGRLLIDQIVYPTVAGGGTVPDIMYPMLWTKYPQTAKVAYHKASGGAWQFPKGKIYTSNNYYINKNIHTGDGSTFVSPNGTWAGNNAANALLADLNKVWTSTGEAERMNSKVWFQVDLTKKTVLSGIRIQTAMARNSAVYISLYGPKGWMGRKKIPYKRVGSSLDLKASIPYWRAGGTLGDNATEIVFYKAFKDITKIRITIAPMAGIGTDGLHPYRASINTLEIYAGALKTMKVVKATRSVTYGNYKDYTDIAKNVVAWAGFYWPDHDTASDYMAVAPGERVDVTYGARDPVLIAGRAWGDFMNSGTAGKVDLTPDLFDKQPFWDVLGYVRDILGFVAFVDETGGFVWRMPNVWTIGNYMSPDDLDPRGKTRVEDYITITDEDVIQSYSTTVSSRNSRESIFVGNTDGKFATVVGGYAADAGVRMARVAGYMDQNFASQAECERMADLIATKQKFAARKSRVRIPGYPAIQIDDQIRIYEKVTNETFFHYVEGITSSLDIRSGTWTYDLSTHWLGEQQQDSWVVDRQAITSEMKFYLQQIGVL